uniref:Capsid-associated protein VP80 n=1 Tax=Spodoptera littoralis nuclear polyhedrosis virus TaxID=10456 RepID=A0A3G4S8Z6_NPVSL|nr:capsid-associated protein VP80 [Spodoptera littoralis nucleopolyhedrovirus]
MDENELLMNASMLRYRTLDAKLKAISTMGSRSSGRFDADAASAQNRLDQVRPFLTRDVERCEREMDSINRYIDENLNPPSNVVYRSYVMPDEERNELSVPAPLPPQSSTRKRTNSGDDYDDDDDDDDEDDYENINPATAPEYASWFVDLSNMIVILDNMVRNRIEPIEQNSQILNNLILLKQQREHVSTILPSIDVNVRNMIDNPPFEDFINIYRKYGIVNVSHEPLRDILNRIRSEGKEADQPPSVRMFIRTLTKNINNRVPIKVNRADVEQVTDPDVKTLLYAYRLQSMLRVVDVDVKKNQPAPPPKRRKRQRQNRTGTSTGGSDSFITDPDTVPSGGGGVGGSDGGGPSIPPSEMIKSPSIKEILEELRSAPEAELAIAPYEEPFYEMSTPDDEDEYDDESRFADGDQDLDFRPIETQQFVSNYLLREGIGSRHPLITTMLDVLPHSGERLAICELKQHLDVRRYSSQFEWVQTLNLSPIDRNVHLYQLLEPLTYYATNETMSMAIGWFVVNAYRYFINAIDDFDHIRRVVISSGFRDADRVALFFVKYNYLFIYRQLLSDMTAISGDELVPDRYMNNRIVVLLKTYDIIVQKQYNAFDFSFQSPPQNSDRPVDRIVLLAVGQTAVAAVGGVTSTASEAVR